MVKGGYSSLMDPLAANLNIQQDVAVSQISYNNQGVKVTSASGELTHIGISVLQPLLFCMTTAEERRGMVACGHGPCSHGSIRMSAPGLPVAILKGSLDCF